MLLVLRGACHLHRQWRLTPLMRGCNPRPRMGLQGRLARMQDRLVLHLDMAPRGGAMLGHHPVVHPCLLDQGTIHLDDAYRSHLTSMSRLMIRIGRCNTTPHSVTSS